LLIAGCTARTTATLTTIPAVRPTAGPAQVAQFDGPGFSIALPDTYVAVDANSDLVAQLSSASDLTRTARDRTIAAIQEDESTFWALDVADATATYVTSVSVTVRDRIDLDDVSVYLTLVGSQYVALGGEAVSIEAATYDFGTAVVVKARVPVGDVEETVVQLLAPVGDRAYSVTFRFHEPAEQDVENALASFATFRPLDG